ncbi:MAG: hypothetical protein K2I93_09060 [Oscillospiraceae bacterium]|nr:hypothetical protein [Oscillospiraceae bacterium]
MSNSYFPIRLGVHLLLALLALLVFGMQFIRFRKSHYLVLAIALPCTLLPYLSDSTTFFYTVGVAEFVALIASFILSNTVDRDKSEQITDTQEQAAETTAEAEEEA